MVTVTPRLKIITFSNLTILPPLTVKLKKLPEKIRSRAAREYSDLEMRPIPRSKLKI